MVTMLAIMKDTDDHFAKVAVDLEEIKSVIATRPKLTIVKSVDD